ncbi:UPF0643 protein [Rutstroemia sp. NJR-2017a BBW]|nr:UPF0643 protein [Rutstroemia sp. NJR-2017a BBW]
MAVVTSPTLPFETVERHDISRALESATSLQNPIPSSNVEAIDHNRYLVVSPYDELPHLLDLETLDTANQLLSRALSEMKCLREDYATAPYIETFNWPEIIDTLRQLARTSSYTWKEQSFYIVAFRSLVPPSTVQRYSDLGALDKAAHAEATESGGFLKYVNNSANPQEKLTISDIGLEFLIKMDEILQPVSGEVFKMRGLEVWVLHIVWRLMLLDTCIRNGTVCPTLNIRPIMLTQRPS